MHPAGFPYLGEEFAANARLPGTGQRWFRHGAVLVGYACFAALAIVLGPTGGRGLAGAVAAAAPVVLFPAMRILGRCLARIALRPSWGFETVEAPGLGAALMSAGLRQVTVVTAVSGRRQMQPVAFSFRPGRRGIIGLSAQLKDPKRVAPDVTRFVTAHEAAHLVRDDTMTHDLLRTGRLCLLLVIALTAPGSLWLLLPLVTVPIAVSWRIELACDRLAIEAVGPMPALLYVDYYGKLVEGRRSRPLLRRRNWLSRGAVTHPPWRMRRNVIAKQVRASPGPVLSHCQQMVATAEEALDPFDIRLTGSLRRAASILAAAHQDAQAIEALVRAVTINDRYGAETASAATDLRNLAELQFRNGQDQEAWQNLNRARDISERHPKPDG